MIAPRFLGAKGSGHAGAMAALYLPAEVGEKLAVDGGEKPADMHVTLAYAKEPNPEHIGAMRLACKSAAKAAGAPLGMRLGGVGRFSASETSDGKDVHHVTVDSHALGEFRGGLVKAMWESGVPLATDHGWTPHITVKYLDPDADPPAGRFNPQDISIGALSLVHSGGTREDFPFARDSQIAVAAKAVRAVLAAHRRATMAPITKAIAAKILNPQPPKDPAILTPGLPFPDETHPHLLIGLAMRPNIVDGDGDTYDAETVQRAAHWYMVNGRLTGTNHSWIPDPELLLVESAILRWPLDPAAKIDLIPDDWFIGVAVTQRRFEEYLAGLWHGFSFGGAINREEL